MAKIEKDSLLSRLKKNSTLENVAVLAESTLFAEKDSIITEVPLINAALAGDMDFGMVPGLLQLVGESRTFKTSFLLLMIRAFQRKFPNGVALFYDSEFGAPEAYFDAFEIDKDRILHLPVTDVEMLKFDVAKQLELIQKGDQIFIAIDSIGNLASKKEAEDAIEGKSVADMTRAKQINSFFRIVTPHLTTKSIYMVVINHGYKEMALYPRTIIGGGQKSVLSSDNIWIITRETEKDKNKDVIGYTFNVTIEKSRYSRDKIKIPITVTHDGGLEKYSGLLEYAIEAGFVNKVKPGRFARVDVSTGEIFEEELDENETGTDEFWKDILADGTFKEFIRTKFKLAYSNLLPTYQPTEVK